MEKWKNERKELKTREITSFFANKLYESNKNGTLKLLSYLGPNVLVSSHYKGRIVSAVI